MKNPFSTLLKTIRSFHDTSRRLPDTVCQVTIHKEEISPFEDPWRELDTIGVSHHEEPPYSDTLRLAEVLELSHAEVLVACVKYQNRLGYPLKIKGNVTILSKRDCCEILQHLEPNFSKLALQCLRANLYYDSTLLTYRITGKKCLVTKEIVYCGRFLADCELSNKASYYAFTLVNSNPNGSMTTMV